MDLGYGSTLHEEELQQQQEVALRAMRDDDDDRVAEERGKTRWHQSETEEISRGNHNSKGNDPTGDEDDEDPRPARWRKRPQYPIRP